MVFARLKGSKCTFNQRDELCGAVSLRHSSSSWEGGSAPASLQLVSLSQPCWHTEEQLTQSPTAVTMCSRRPNDPRGPDDAGDDGLCPQCRSPSSCDEFRDYRRLAHIMNICREYDQAAEGEFLSHDPQVKALCCLYYT